LKKTKRKRDIAGVLKRIHERNRDPVPFVDCGNLPWNDPDVSRRILEIHLSQETDQASRREEIILSESAFLDGVIRSLAGEGQRVLDIGCGPGLYATELAKFGHRVVGVDFAPAAIEYAKEQLEGTGLPIEYVSGDIRRMEFEPESFDACFYNYAMPNALTREDLTALTEKISEWLRPGGVYVSELLTIEGLKSDLTKEWDSFEKSAFSSRPHLWLDEKLWHESTLSQVYRVYLIDLDTGDVREYAESHQGYTLSGYKALLKSKGLAVSAIYGDMEGEPLSADSEWAVFVAIKS
jgi:SAM-dependent methyltransferase